MSSFQIFDLDGLKGRLKSSSYCPKETTPQFFEIMKEITHLFEKYKDTEGKVKFEYEVQMYLSPIQ